MTLTSKTDCERKVAITGPFGTPSMWLEESTGGWHRLIHDLFADEKIGVARQAMSQAAARVDLMAETARLLAGQMLPACRNS